ncbi:hypothetical protein [Sporomusa ovata]|uniref:hypothetical protein n=1 Tax=Sporomusa ovata TaxID=2378 RepID=UPI00286B8562|nr:hypothetical protein [Sporomusa ovata]
MEACYSMGMTRYQTMVRVVLPQAFVVALPTLGFAATYSTVLYLLRLAFNRHCYGGWSSLPIKSILSVKLPVASCSSIRA